MLPSSPRRSASGACVTAWPRAANKLPPSPAVDVVEAASAGWLELWHQPKIDNAALLLCGAEALIRIRHPTWGSSRQHISFPMTAIPTCARFRSL